MRKAAVRTALVIGGHGAMGRWLCGVLRRPGLQVLVHDPKGAPRGFREAPFEAAREADFVALAVPLSSVAHVADRVLALRPRGVVFDLASLKTPLLVSFERALREGARITSIHPLFGPSTRLTEARNLLICDVGDLVSTRRVRALFAGSGLTVRLMSAAEHDTWIAKTMGLAHLLALIAGSVLAREGVSAKALAGRVSTSARRLWDLVAPVLEQDPELTRAIQLANPHAAAVFEGLARETAAVWGSLGDATVFQERLEEVRKRLGSKGRWNHR